ncbi:gas vesicle protein [Luteitalea sp. TBR-22]|uniref:GvpL/GvpF family gas vesicle protein n=1 Tax=Luteitalea sp. TBR-22 TaxID=2802971 RepID=UPI001AF2B93C|nr:GvpL/GvpF family gas vesicle protein [Luteitalea sp. TBR-22]BCS31989.1 gas vesicle protein [Luteitalea sp. TBR-22]
MTRKDSTSHEPDRLLHVHGVLRSDTVPRLGRVTGMPGAVGSARAIAVTERHWMIVSDVPAAGFTEEAIRSRLEDLEWLGRCAASHHDLLGRAMRSGPVVPLRLFTIFATEARALAHVRDALPGLAVLFERLDGRVEYGVRASRAQLAPAGVPPATVRRLTPAPASGRDFLERKRALLRERQPIAVDERWPALVEARVRAHAEDVRHRPLPAEGGRVWLDLAALVPVTGGSAFARDIRALAREMRGHGHEVTLTGPWPPFTFIDEPLDG